MKKSPGPHSSGGWPGAGGSAPGMARSRGCWREVQVSCHMGSSAWLPDGPTPWLPASHGAGGLERHRKSRVFCDLDEAIGPRLEGGEDVHHGHLRRNVPVEMPSGGLTTHVGGRTWRPDDWSRRSQGMSHRRRGQREDGVQERQGHCGRGVGAGTWALPLSRRRSHGSRGAAYAAMEDVQRIDRRGQGQEQGGWRLSL